MFTNKIDRHDIAEILLKVALNTITLTLKLTQTQIKNVIAIKQTELWQTHTLPNFGPGAFYFWGKNVADSIFSESLDPPLIYVWWFWWWCLLQRPRYNWNIVESGVKHHKPTFYKFHIWSYAAVHISPLRWKNLKFRCSLKPQNDQIILKIIYNADCWTGSLQNHHLG